MILQPPKSTLFPYIFFFNDTATTEIYTLSLHDALPISQFGNFNNHGYLLERRLDVGAGGRPGGRKSTRLNSSHLVISYAVFCLKKKKISSRNTIVCIEFLLKV